LDVNTYEVPASELQRAAKAASLVSDHLAFGANTGATGVYAEAEGDTDDVVVHMESSGTAPLDNDEESLFSLDYLEAMVAELPDGDVTMRLGDDYPTKLRAEFGEEAEATYLLAPRIENE